MHSRHLSKLPDSNWVSLVLGSPVKGLLEPSPLRDERPEAAEIERPLRSTRDGPNRLNARKILELNIGPVPEIRSVVERNITPNALLSKKSLYIVYLLPFAKACPPLTPRVFVVMPCVLSVCVSSPRVHPPTGTELFCHPNGVWTKKHDTPRPRYTRFRSSKKIVPTKQLSFAQGSGVGDASRLSSLKVRFAGRPGAVRCGLAEVSSVNVRRDPWVGGATEGASSVKVRRGATTAATLHMACRCASSRARRTLSSTAGSCLYGHASPHLQSG